MSFFSNNNYFLYTRFLRYSENVGFLYMTNFQIYGKLLSWQKAQFSGPPKMAIFRTTKIGYFRDL